MVVKDPQRAVCGVFFEVGFHNFIHFLFVLQEVGFYLNPLFSEFLNIKETLFILKAFEVLNGLEIFVSHRFYVLLIGIVCCGGGLRVVFWGQTEVLLGSFSASFLVLPSDVSHSALAK